MELALKIFETLYFEECDQIGGLSDAEALIAAHVREALEKAAGRVHSLMPNAENDSPDSDFVVDRVLKMAIAAILADSKPEPRQSAGEVEALEALQLLVDANVGKTDATQALSIARALLARKGE